MRASFINRYWLFMCISVSLLSGCNKMNLTVAGKMKNNETWSGRVELKGDVHVPRGVVLTVQPGTSIVYTRDKLEYEMRLVRNVMGEMKDIFEENRIDLVIEGRLMLSGKKDKPVIIGNPGPAGVVNEKNGGITFIGNEKGSVIEHAVFRYGTVALRCYDDTSPEIRNCKIVKHDIGGIGVWDGASPCIHDNEILENRYGIGISDFSEAEISSNLIKNNKAAGIFVEGGAKPLLNSNIIEGNNVGIAAGDYAKPRIVNSKIKGNGGGIGVWNNAVPRIEKNEIFKNVGGVVAANESAPVILNNIIKGNGGGVASIDSSSALIESNDFESNGRAVVCSDSSSPVIKENRFISNDSGLDIEHVSAPVVRDNTLQENGTAIYLRNHARPVLKGNKLIRNGAEMKDERAGR